MKKKIIPGKIDKLYIRDVSYIAMVPVKKINEKYKLLYYKNNYYQYIKEIENKYIDDLPGETALDKNVGQGFLVKNDPAGIYYTLDFIHGDFQYEVGFDYIKCRREN